MKGVANYKRIEMLGPGDTFKIGVEFFKVTNVKLDRGFNVHLSFHPVNNTRRRCFMDAHSELVVEVR